ncbi:MAG: methyltransferase domain-containing protein [Cyanobacteria bacterium]|jgi:hypothetical protein|nr:methyltransferase domain-containing protein [Cyanobacteria bacterium GSL.Bin21]
MNSEIPSVSPASNTELDTEGFYVQDVDFRSGILALQTPALLAMTAAMGGFKPPAPTGAFTYCDLGCGDGTTLNALASLHPEATFVGVDFNPSHIATARETAEHCQLTNTKFVEAAFTDLPELDLPSFDFVTANGVYAWLEEPQAQAVRNFVGEQLRPGGLFYVEYTSLPGKISVAPLWQLIQTLVPQEAYPDSRDRAQAGLDLVETFAKRGVAYLAAHRPAANGARSYIQGRKRDAYRVDHFAHNAMASGFRPRYFTEMYDEMAAVGMIYAGRVEIALNEIELSVPPAQVPTFQDYKHDIRLTELLKDYIRNEQQRHDIFVRDGSRDPEAANAYLDEQLRLLSRLPANRTQRTIATVGNHRIALRGPAYEALIQAADEEQGVTPAEAAAAKNLPIERLRRAALRLFASNQFFLCTRHPERASEDTESITAIEVPNLVNQRTLALAAERLTQNQLVSPITGGAAIPISAIEAILLLSTLEAGHFDGAIQRAQERLKNETRPLPSGKGQKPAKDLQEDELGEVLRALRGRKLFNLLKLGVVTPKAE